MTLYYKYCITLSIVLCYCNLSIVSEGTAAVVALRILCPVGTAGDQQFWSRPLPKYFSQALGRFNLDVSFIELDAIWRDTDQAL